MGGRAKKAAASQGAGQKLHDLHSVYKLTGMKVDAHGALSGPLLKKGGGKMSMGLGGRNWKLKHFVLQGNNFCWFEDEQQAQDVLADGVISQEENSKRGRFIDLADNRHGKVTVTVSSHAKYDAILEVNTEGDATAGPTLSLRADPLAKVGADAMKVTLTAWQNALNEVLNEAHLHQAQATRSPLFETSTPEYPCEEESSSSSLSEEESTDSEDAKEPTAASKPRGVEYASSRALEDEDHAPLRKGLASATEEDLPEFQRIRLRPASPTKMFISPTTLEHVDLEHREPARRPVTPASVLIDRAVDSRNAWKAPTQPEAEAEEPNPGRWRTALHHLNAYKTHEREAAESPVAGKPTPSVLKRQGWRSLLDAQAGSGSVGEPHKPREGSHPAVKQRSLYHHREGKREAAQASTILSPFDRCFDAVLTRF